LLLLLQGNFNTCRSRSASWLVRGTNIQILQLGSGVQVGCLGCGVLKRPGPRDA